MNSNSLCSVQEIFYFSPASIAKQRAKRLIHFGLRSRIQYSHIYIIFPDNCKAMRNTDLRRQPTAAATRDCWPKQSKKQKSNLETYPISPLNASGTLNDA